MILFCPRCGSEFPAKFRGEWFDSGPICSDCGVAVGDPPAMLAPSEAEMTYGLDEWPVADRAAVTSALVDDDVPYRWEAGVVLVVPDAVEALVDGILDDLEGSGPAPDLWDDGEAADPDADLDSVADETPTTPRTPRTAKKPTGERRRRRPCPTCSWSPTGSNTPRGIPTSTPSSKP